ncbi:MAG TPA: tRNA (adenosine(37)-N6)-threonylcarbamoyltransferase complex transferase subunit TsaD [Planctomycetaceae bacterium]|nr:tRNA (adenosine(37)-N6)-threonylcarbamoyltransferase complex transferase subunit TsaD [Pirellulales bacterium]HAL15067.1 tRNA (adenosine(37)-N6)-threonylcarbamoyltransferase complex transferase subunit TsaD [Planctomycetaceae bacterium]HCK70367.1 tRNA (adenosine(37)-N6)-threonylcarbamoyltransferase complex transferase subunit TsaD [Planctomycetaceae bacterium]
MQILTIESTCDETAAAVVNDQLEVISAVVASQEALHQKFTGVVPEIAARAHVERIVPVIDEAMTRAGVQWNELDAIAVANEPGLAGSLLVGVVAAKALCLAHDLPLVAVNHLHAHIYACRIAAKRDLFPCVGLIVSGGHSNLYVCHDALTFEPLGATIDDAAGEAFDKVASMLQLPYPGGPSVSKAALEGDKTKYDFPRPMLKDRETLNLSFSGLKTAVRYTIAPQGQVDFKTLDLEPQLVADVSASFQQAVIDCLVGKTVLALEQTDIKMLCVGGGVAANRELRGQLEEAVSSMGVELHIAPFELCTDNAVMGAIAFERLKAGITESLDLDIKAGLVRMA